MEERVMYEQNGVSINDGSIATFSLADLSTMTDEEQKAFDDQKKIADEAKAQAEAAEKRVADSQEMIQKQSADVGEERKDKDEFALATKKLMGDLVHKAHLL